MSTLQAPAPAAEAQGDAESSIKSSSRHLPEEEVDRATAGEA